MSLGVKIALVENHCFRMTNKWTFELLGNTQAQYEKGIIFLEQYKKLLDQGHLRDNGL